MTDRGELLRRTIVALGDEPYALIGGQALLVYGIARQTDDIDLLVGTSAILDRQRWPSGEPPVTLRRSQDVGDPLDGVAVLSAGTDEEGAPLPASPAATEVIVLDRPWARAIVRRAEGRASVAGVDVPVVDLPDLAILKAYAGGPIDRADVAAMVGREDWPTVRAAVEARLTAGPKTAAQNWKRWMRLFDEP